MDNKEILLEQLKFSSEKLQELQNDSTPKGKEEFEHHVSLINDIKSRITIAQESKENLEELKKTLSELEK